MVKYITVTGNTEKEFTDALNELSQPHEIIHVITTQKGQWTMWVALVKTEEKTDAAKDV